MNILVLHLDCPCNASWVPLPGHHTVQVVNPQNGLLRAAIRGSIHSSIHGIIITIVVAIGSLFSSVDVLSSCLHLIPDGEPQGGPSALPTAAQACGEVGALWLESRRAPDTILHSTQTNTVDC